MIIAKKPDGSIFPREYEPYSDATFVPSSFLVEATAEQVLAEFTPATFDFLPGRKFIAFDTETFAYGTIPANRLPKSVVRRWIKRGTKYIPNDFPFCLSLSNGKKSWVIYDDLQNKYAALKALAPILEDLSIEKIAHNVTFDMHMLANAGVEVCGRFHDTSYMSRLTRANAFTHSLFDITKEFLGAGIDGGILTYERMLLDYKAKHKINDYRYFPKKLMTQYTGADTWNCMYVFPVLYQMLIDNEQVELYECECKVGKIAYWAEREGIKIVSEYEHELIPTLEKELAEAEEKIYATAGCLFNINSGQQLEQVLTKLGYADQLRRSDPTANMLAKGQIVGNACFNKYEKERLANAGVPLIKDIQAFQDAQKLLNTFARKIYDMVDGDGFLHCNFNTMEAKTGRFSISTPSMQNMPRRKDDRVRGAFTAEAGYTLYDFDFKSQEAIVLAHYSKSEYLLDMIREGHDIHKATASIVYQKPLAEVTKDERSAAKSVGFAITYGAGAAKVAAMNPGMTADDARIIMKTYMRNIPEVDKFIKTANAVMKERGRIRTRLNRHVYAERGREYACVNYVIQGSSADSTKTRMVKLYNFLTANGYKSKIILQIHDSLNGKIANDEAAELIPYWKWLQTDRDLFRVTVPVDVAICSPTWRDKKDIAVEAIQPPAEMLEKAENYNMWKEGILQHESDKR